MKRIKRVAALILILLFGLFVGLAYYVGANGKEILTDQLNKALNVPVSLGDVRFSLPFNLRVRDISIEGYGKAKEANIGLGPLYLFKKELYFPYVYLSEPTVIIQRTQIKTEESSPAEPTTEGSTTEPQQSPVQPLPTAKETAPVKTSESKSRSAINIYVRKLIIRDGQVDFIDRSGEKNLSYTAKEINVRVRRFSYPFRAFVTEFDVDAKVVSSDQKKTQGVIESHGWVNLGKKDMQTTVAIKDLDSELFSRYYSGENDSGFKGMMVNLSANLVSKNNDMTVQGQLRLKTAPAAEKEENAQDSFSIEDYIVQGLRSIGAEIASDFHFKTKMDDFKIEKMSFQGAIVQGD
ncbi:MAG: DUF748 domain-containing protein [Candidatus Omnitrophota bacterium]